MIKDLGLFSWRIGLVLIIALPLLYIAQAMSVFVVGADAGNPVYQALSAVMMVAPAIFLSIGIGCALCLLVRIEMHLRPKDRT